MQVRIQHDPTLDDIHVLIEYAEHNQMLGRLLGTIKGLGEKIEAYDEDRTVMLNVLDVYYFESVDKRTFAYCKSEVYRVSDRLYQIKEKLERLGFVQVSKACILNINMLESIKNVGNARMEAELSNGEHVCVSRRYIPDIKKALRR